MSWAMMAQSASASAMAAMVIRHPRHRCNAVARPATKIGITGTSIREGGLNAPNQKLKLAMNAKYETSRVSMGPLRTHPSWRGKARRP